MISYFISVAAVALICSVCKALSPRDGGLDKALSLACVVVLILTVIYPIKSIIRNIEEAVDFGEEDTSTCTVVSDEYRLALAYQTARTAASFAESKFSVSSDSLRISVDIPDGSSIPDKITVYLTDGGEWISSVSLEEYLTDKMGVECIVKKEAVS